MMALGTAVLIAASLIVGYVMGTARERIRWQREEERLRAIMGTRPELPRSQDVSHMTKIRWSR